MTSVKTEGWHGEGNGHRAGERKRGSGLLAAITACGAIASAMLSTIALINSQHAADSSRRAAQEAARQADAAFAELRPWLQVELTLVGLRFLPDLNAEFVYDVKTKNVGKSPARDIRSRIEAVPLTKDGATNSIPAQKQLCDRAREDAKDEQWPGPTIFAGEVGVGTLGIAGIGRAYVEHDQYATAFAGPANVVMQVVGCFDYVLPSGEHGQTGFTYRLARAVPGGSGQRAGFNPRPGVVPIEEISFDRDPFSGGYVQ